MAIRERQKWFLREWRKHRELTQEKLAERLGTTKSVISDLEVGKKRYNQDQLEALATALDCEPADLLIRNPLDPEAVWSIWDRIRPEKREDALRVLEALADAPTEPRQKRRRAG